MLVICLRRWIGKGVSAPILTGLVEGNIDVVSSGIWDEAPCDAGKGWLLDAQDLQRLADLIVGSGLPGVAIAGKVEGQLIVATAGAGSLFPKRAMTKSARVPLACAAKSLIALLCLELHVRGALDIHRDVEEYLPELASGNGMPSITLAQLLSHAPGYIEPQEKSVRWTMSWEEFARAYAARRQAFLPGMVWSYTQTGIAIVARIVESVLGDNLFEFIRREILAPIGADARSADDVSAKDIVAPHAITERGYRPIFVPKDSNLLRYSISPLLVCVEDLLQIGCLIGGSVRPPFLSGAAFELYSRTAIDIPASSGGGVKEALPSAFGYGQPIYGPLVGQAGSYVGTTNSIRFDRASGTAFAAFFNAWVPGARDALMSRLFLEATGKPDFIRSTRCRIARPIADWSGSYTGLGIGAGTALITMKDNVLVCRIEMPDSEPMVAELATDAEGYLVGTVAQPWSSIALATVPKTDEPYFIFGMSAYKRDVPRAG